MEKMNDLLELGKQYKSTKDRAGFLEIYSNYFNDFYFNNRDYWPIDWSIINA